MINVRLSVLYAGLVILAINPVAYAQVTNPYSNAHTNMGGSASSGTGVPTGRGPLSQPSPPAVSSLNNLNNQQNLQGNNQRAQGQTGPVQTPAQLQPFGGR